MKKFLAILLAMVMILSCGVFATSAEEELTTVTVLGYERNPGFMAGCDTQLVWKAAEKMFADAGIVLDFEIIEDSEQFKTTVQTRLAAAHELPDLIYGGSTDTTTLLDMADLGVILKINEILELTKGNAYNYFYGGEGERARKLLSDAEGNFYWLPRIQINQLNGEEAGTSMCMCICIRQDWLDKLDLEVPNSLDSFEAALKAFQDNDVNGTGIVDEVMVSDTSGFTVGMNLWFGIPTCMSNSIGINLTEKTVESAWYNENIEEYFTYVQKLVKEKLLSADYIGTDTSFSALLSGNQVSAMDYYPVGTYQEATVIAGGCPEAYYIGIYPFDAVEGTKAFYSEETPYLVYLRHCVTQAASDKLDVIAKLYDVIYSDEYIKLTEYGTEGDMYTEDADGTITDLSGNGILPVQERFDKGMATVDEIYRHFLPNLRHNERMNELDFTAAGGWQAKVDYELATADYQPRTPNDNTGYFALATTEENEVLSSLETDLITASQELAANISLGNIAVEDIPAEVENLKAMGLDEVLAIYTARYERANGN